MNLLTTTESPSTRAENSGTEEKYRLAVIAAARTGESIDATLLESAGRFLTDFSADVLTMRRRLEAADAIEAADAELTRLAANAPPPRPARDIPVESFKTLGELKMALSMLDNPNAVTAGELEHHRLTSEATGHRARAVGILRHTAAKRLHAQIAAAHDEIAKRRGAVSKRERMEKQANDLEREVNSVVANTLTTEERTAWHVKRKELATLRTRLSEPAPTADVSDLHVEIERLAAEELDPLNVDFPKPEPPAGAMDFVTPQGRSW